MTSKVLELILGFAVGFVGYIVLSAIWPYLLVAGVIYGVVHFLTYKP